MEPVTKLEDNELQKAINNITSAGETGAVEMSAAGAAVPDPVVPDLSASGDETGDAMVGGAMGAVEMPTPEIATPEVTKPVSGNGEKSIEEVIGAVMERAGAVGSEPVASSESETEEAGGGKTENSAVKAKALAELRPLIEKVELSAEAKFKIYREIIETADDKTVLEAAYEAAAGIADDKEKAEALLFIIEKA